MTKYIGQCDRCKKEFGSWGFARYYCDECAEEVIKAVRRYEMGGAV